MFDLAAYFERLGLAGAPGLAEIHRAHVCAIPFENLDPHRGVAVALDDDALQRKLVAERRGGYCFEHNLLLQAALEAALDARVEPMLARVRWGTPPGTVRPRSHLVLRAIVDGVAWHADVGFGAGTLLDPIPFGPGGPYEQSGWRFRVVEEAGELVLQTSSRGQWLDLYAFAPAPVPPIDIEVSNWFTATHPASGFVTGLIVARQRPDGTRLSLSDWNALELVTRTPDGAEAVPVERRQIPQLLRDHFDLPGFVLNAAGRVELAEHAGAPGRKRGAPELGARGPA